MARHQNAGKSSESLTVAMCIIAGLAIVVGVYALVRYHGTQKPAALNPNDPKVVLAQCLTDKGAKMYGAYWCPHCAAQKKDFGDAFAKVTYVECAIPGDTQDQTQPCKDNKIEGYPTWIFADGSRVSGEQTLENLAMKSGCSYNGAGPSPASNTNAPSAAPAVNASAK